MVELPSQRRGVVQEVAVQTAKKRVIGVILAWMAPVLLPILAVIMIAFAVVALAAESTSACAPDGAVTVGGENNTQIAYNYLVSQPELGLKPFQAAAIVGNFIHESGGDPIKTDNPNQSSGAIGIAHWLGGRLDSLKAHKFQEKNWTDIYFQLDFLRYELLSYQRGSLDAVKRTTTIAEATTVFEAKFERSGVTSSYPIRTAHAISVYERYAGKVGTPVPTVTTNVEACKALEGVDSSLRDPGEGPQDPNRYNLVPRASNLRDVVFNRWGCDQTKLNPCIREIGGYSVRPSGPQDHTYGLALDITISDGIGSYPNSSQLALGWQIACFTSANAKELGVRYIIWQGIWLHVEQTLGQGGPGKCSGTKTGWIPYTKGYQVTDGHYDHIHITVQPGVGG